jgi:predicted dehydrogenase
VIHVGLVGRGTWGRLILRDLRSLGAEVTVVDPDQADGALVAVADLGAVDGVVVATPATTHAAVIDSLLDRNVPIFCEKPFTTDVASARDLVARAGERIHLMHVWRYHPGVELLGALVRSGVLGEPIGVHSTRVNGPSPRLDTDPVWTLVPHDLTVALEVLGHLPSPMAAVADAVEGRALGMHALCGPAPWLAIHASTRHVEKRREVRVHGRDAVAVLSRDDSTEVRIERGSEVERRPVTSDPPLRRELAAFLDHLTGGPPPKSDAAEGLAVVEAVQALRDLAGLDEPDVEP